MPSPLEYICQTRTKTHREYTSTSEGSPQTRASSIWRESAPDTRDGSRHRASCGRTSVRRRGGRHGAAGCRSVEPPSPDARSDDREEQVQKRESGDRNERITPI